MFQSKLIFNTRKNGEAPNITWPKILKSNDNCSKFTLKMTTSTPVLS